MGWGLGASATEAGLLAELQNYPVLIGFIGSWVPGFFNAVFNKRF